MLCNWNVALLVGLTFVVACGYAEPVSFTRDIAPVLRDKCLTCHGPEKAKGQYRVDTFELLNRPGSSKAAPITPGAVEKSHLYELLTAADPDDRMPQKDEPLPKATIVLIEQWIREGANFDGNDPKGSLVSVAAVAEQPMPLETYAAPVPVTALTFIESGERLAIGGYHEITIWDPTDGALLDHIVKVPQRTFALACCDARGLIAAASGTPGRLGETRVFDVKTGALIRTLTTTSDSMLDVSFDSAGDRLACAGTDNAIRVFDVASRRAELTIEQHADWVMDVAFSPDGKAIVSASRDKTARVFDANTGELEATYTGHTEAVFAAEFTVDGKRVISAGRDRKIHIWDAKDAKKAREISGFDADVTRLRAGNSGLFVASGKEVRLYHVDGERELIRTFRGHGDVVYSLALDEKSGRLASGSHDGEVRIWKIEDGQLLRAFRAMPKEHASK